MAGIGSLAAAASAAIFGPALAASADHPALSRRLTNLRSAPLSSVISRKSASSCVQPTVSGAFEAARARNLSSSARQNWRPVTISKLLQPRADAPASSGIVSSHEQTRILCRSVIGRYNGQELG